MAIRINRVYTRTGDRGMTRLVGGTQVSKASQRIEAFGAVDELNSILGLARTFNQETLAGGGGSARQAARELDDVLTRLQNELFDLGSELATPPDGEYPGMFKVGDAEVETLEKRIDRCQRDLEPLESFVLPGGGKVAAFLHQARTVCRRAEREAVRLAAEEPVTPGAVKYLNRLSDLLFVLSRWIARQSRTPELLWERGLHLGDPGAREGKARAAARKEKETPRGA